jgi:EAL domain-containing protein (putative c-di-GMP-specific phosphodiesterase class I)
MKPFGCKVGVEHFGHHMAALPRLAKMGVHYLKLDRAFCIGVHEEPGQQAFVRLAVEIASALSITVLAEGLTDLRDLQALENLGVAGATGPLVSGLVEAVAA